ncbi:MAG: LPS export ABC transporter permease LptF [Proteobacteria bacterium]|nr:LPS export ABC transporter permease LptF [Pseudomonadota bacterium]
MREVVVTSVVVTAVLLVLLLANQFAAVLERAAVNQFPQSVVLQLIWLGALQNLTILIPVGLLLGVVLAFGRMYHDSEMAAALACGLGPASIYRPIAVLTVLVAAVLAWLTLSLAPDATEQTLNLRSAAARAGRFAAIAPGKFRTFGGTAVVYAEDVKPDGTLGNVFVEHNRGPRVEVALANRARHSVTADGMTHTITLYDGERFEGVPGTPEFRIVRFAEHVVPIQVPMPTDTNKSIEAQPTEALLGSTDPEKRAELHWRLALPVMCLVLTLLAVPLSRLRPRQGRYARVWLAIMVYFVYSNLISAGKVWLAHGKTPDYLGLWWTHIAILVLALLYFNGPRTLANLRLRRA